MLPFNARNVNVPLSWHAVRPGSCVRRAVTPQVLKPVSHSPLQTISASFIKIRAEPSFETKPGEEVVPGAFRGTVTTLFKESAHVQDETTASICCKRVLKYLCSPEECTVTVTNLESFHSQEEEQMGPGMWIDVACGPHRQSVQTR